ncbi:hypothetical protein SISNIDRAFT_420604 [Sistotremastrum niveocremeum HHB9708]|uniref:hAT-like transposase RNase-H fold domain-containing protein n=1 Tax=Sistotremastrum niveocremeum HHB9708 TaxID=1314777 RepID=A0A164MID6_9AGAM|nr:hypothetical protein SISNIDRAFT_420604 [Sistotremastrum niveocremeum HHB9708]
MTRTSHELKAAVDLFIKSADALFGPITTLKVKGQRAKKISWMAFFLTTEMWENLLRCTEVLEDADAIQHLFSSDTDPTLYLLIPVIEELLTAWEDKEEVERYAEYIEGLKKSRLKVQKYYNKFDKKPAIILSLAIHPYYKLWWIKIHWGGAEEKAKEIAEGNPDAIDWHEVAMKTVEAAVSHCRVSHSLTFEN